jgi:hypothetical protein
MPGRVYVYLSPDDAAGAADQFNRYGILKENELPGPDDNRISAVSFECDLAAMVDKDARRGDSVILKSRWPIGCWHSSIAANGSVRSC